ncbi:YigZ family protein [Sulfurimonas marina]|uniref:YigZ family protein n=1 Tax=Sulfurimonas marina TaxID=2590551 RepID=A0A7M1AU03_9BACT|nr:YigZ family protein [Sulfurimonas marina]QOP40911.1 YigZ family protein [Sulfurimonas marina]
MQYIQKHFTSTLEVKQSKFIAHLIPYELYETTLEQLKVEHPKARHFVTAFRYLNEYDQVVEHSSDDGEPKGTSGKPSLMVLQGQELINIAVIVVRYFGGTKLGTGGLVRAYSDAVNQVINEAELSPYEKEFTQKVSVDYADIRLLEYECETADIKIVDKNFTTDAEYILKASQENLKTLLEKLKRVVKVLSS